MYGKLVCGECHNVTQNPLGHYLCHNCHFDLVSGDLTTGGIWGRSEPPWLSCWVVAAGLSLVPISLLTGALSADGQQRHPLLQPRPVSAHCGGDRAVPTLGWHLLGLVMSHIPLHPNDAAPHFLHPQGKSPGVSMPALVALTVSPVSHRPLVYTVSILLPAAYLIGLFFTLKTHTHIYDIHISGCHSECPQTSWLWGWLVSLLWSVPHVSALSPVPGHHHSAVVHWSRWRALVILLLSTLCMSACANLATEHISPILTNSTISQVSRLWLSPRGGDLPWLQLQPQKQRGKRLRCSAGLGWGQALADVTSPLQYFISVTVLAMVPELPEIVNGIQFALQNNLSLR